MSQPQPPASMPIASITPAVPTVLPVPPPLPPPIPVSRPPNPAVPPLPGHMGPPPHVPLPPGPHCHIGPPCLPPTPPRLPPPGPNFMRPPHNQGMMGPRPGFIRPPNVPYHMLPPRGRFERPPHPRPDFMHPRRPMIPPSHMPFPVHRGPPPRPHPGMPVRVGSPLPQHNQYMPPLPTDLVQGHTNYPPPGIFTRPIAPPEQLADVIGTSSVNVPSGHTSLNESVSAPPDQISNNEITSSVSGVDDEMEIEPPEEDMETVVSLEPNVTSEHQPTSTDIVFGSVPDRTVSPEDIQISNPEFQVPNSEKELESHGSEDPQVMSDSLKSERALPLPVSESEEQEHNMSGAARVCSSPLQVGTESNTGTGPNEREDLHSAVVQPVILPECTSLDRAGAIEMEDVEHPKGTYAYLICIVALRVWVTSQYFLLQVYLNLSPLLLSHQPQISHFLCNVQQIRNVQSLQKVKIALVSKVAISIQMNSLILQQLFLTLLIMLCKVLLLNPAVTLQLHCLVASCLVLHLLTLYFLNPLRHLVLHLLILYFLNPLRHLMYPTHIQKIIVVVALAILSPPNWKVIHTCLRILLHSNHLLVDGVLISKV